MWRSAGRGTPSALATSSARCLDALASHRSSPSPCIPSRTLLLHLTVTELRLDSSSNTHGLKVQSDCRPVASNHHDSRFQERAPNWHLPCLSCRRWNATEDQLRLYHMRVSIDEVLCRRYVSRSGGSSTTFASGAFSFSESKRYPFTAVLAGFLGQSRECVNVGPWCVPCFPEC